MGLLPMLRSALKPFPAVRRFGGKWLDRRQAQHYTRWLQQFILSDQQLQDQRQEALRLPQRSLLSIVVPTYKTPLQYFHEMVASVQAQTYDNWELLIVDDASDDAELHDAIRMYAESDSRIHYKLLDANIGISGATNVAFSMCRGEYVSLFDHDDLLWPNALFEVASAINEHDIDLIYTDEEKFYEGQSGRRVPFLKPDWNPDLLRSINYITHLTTVRRSMLEEVGNEDKTYEGAQDWELLLRVTRSIAATRIHHIPKVLYGWRVHASSTALAIETKPYVASSQCRLLKEDLKHSGHTTFTVKQDAEFPAQWLIEPKPGPVPCISFVVRDASMQAYVEKNLEAQSDLKYEVVVLGSAGWQEQLRNLQGELVVFVERQGTDSLSNLVGRMAAEARDQEVGFIVAQCNTADIYKNLRELLEPAAYDYVVSSSERDLSKHFYLTTRYTIKGSHAGLLLIAKAHLLAHIDKSDTTLELEIVSRRASENGLRNIFNPYIR